jgi:hypothetical protein
VLVALAFSPGLTLRLYPYVVAPTDRVPHEVVHDSLSVSVGTFNQWRGGSQTGFDPGDRG